jgi:aldose 1-epimerase
MFERDGTALTETYPDDAIAPRAAGLTLAPWANRIRDGRWTLDGKAKQLDITEPGRGHAIHGLLRNTAYASVRQEPASVSLEASIHPQHGYPFLLRHRVSYTVTAAGALEVTQTLINDGAQPAPFVLGAHPYLRIGSVPTEQLTLTVRAAERLVVDEAKIPVGREEVSGDYDLRAGTVTGRLDLDAGYTALTFDGGRATSTLRAPDGRSVWMWQDESCPYLQVFVTGTFPGRAVAVALEPMSGPANAFNSAEDIRWLAAGETRSTHWGIDADLG